MAEQNENYKNDTLDENSKIDSTPYLKIAEHGRSSRTKALKLKIEDVIVAVDGTEFRSTSDNLVDLLSSEEHGKWLLTIFPGDSTDGWWRWNGPWERAMVGALGH